MPSSLFRYLCHQCIELWWIQQKQSLSNILFSVRWWYNRYQSLTHQFKQYTLQCFLLFTFFSRTQCGKAGVVTFSICKRNIYEEDNMEQKCSGKPIKETPALQVTSGYATVHWWAKCTKNLHYGDKMRKTCPMRPHQYTRDNDTKVQEAVYWQITWTFNKVDHIGENHHSQSMWRNPVPPMIKMDKHWI